MDFGASIEKSISFFARARIECFRAALILLTMTAAAGAAGDLEDIKSSDFKRKYTALENLAKSPSPDAAETLVAVALQEKDVRFTLALLDQISAKHEQRVIPLLAPMLQRKSVLVRKRAVQVIGLMGGSLAERALLDALRQEKDSEVTDAILQALSLCGSERSVDAIAPYLANSRSASRANAIQALGRLPGKKASLCLRSHRETDPGLRKSWRQAMDRKAEEAK